MSSADCGCDSVATPLVPGDEAIRHLLERAQPLQEIEWVETTQALGRVLAENQQAAVSVPAWDNSAMDGYAVSTADLQDEMPRLQVAQRIAAGSVGETLQPMTAARIFTGAPIPPGSDAVVMQEQCQRDGDWVMVLASVAAGANIRCSGEDVAEGEVILQAGVKLQPQHLGLAASVGLARLPVVRRLKVAILSTGDELASAGQPLGPGQIYDSNRYTFSGLLQGLGCEVIDMGQVADDFEITCDALKRAGESADLVLASGGVSVGEEDHVKNAVETLGELSLWRLAIRPGKPLAFGQVNGTPFIGVPGNPVSLFVTFSILIRPFILRTQGMTEVLPKAIPVTADFDWPKPDKRREYMRARVRLGEQGQLLAEPHPSRSSGVLSSVVWGDGLLVLDEERRYQRGEQVSFIPFESLLN